MDRRAAACRNARHPDRWSFPASAARVRAAHGLTRRAGLSAARRRGVVIRRSGSNVARGLAAGVTAPDFTLLLSQHNTHAGAPEMELPGCVRVDDREPG